MSDIIQGNTVIIKCVGSDKEYTVPADININTLSFLGTTTMSGSEIRDGCAKQAAFDALINPESMTEKLLVSAIVGAQNRSNELYERAMNAGDVQVKSVYLRYASKFADRVAPLAEALARQKQKSQKIVVERINIERGAQAVVGNVNHA
jgi:hypothetical protein